MFNDGGEGGGVDSEKLYACLPCFCRASDGAGSYLYYCVFYVRVKLNSWHRNIEALFKKQQDVYLTFFIADTN